MKTGLLLGLLAIAGVNMFLPAEVLLLLMIVLLILITPTDRAIVYNSSFTVIFPFLLLVLIGIVRGLHDMDRDFYRDISIFSKNIFYFLGGIALSKYLKDFNTFFKYFLFLAFISALIHIGLIIINIHSISSLETIRYVAGYGNDLEGVVAAIIFTKMFNRNFGKLIEFTPKMKVLSFIIVISFLLYFSRTLIIIAAILPLFLFGSINIRQIFSRKNAKILKIPVLVLVLFYVLSLIASLQAANSPLQTLIDKFENIPEEIGWNAHKNATSTKEDIQSNWRGYEAYQGLLKFYQGSDLQKCIGHGFGEKVDLGIIMKLGGKDYDTVPILHNEYVMLLVKCGVVGLVLYLIALYYIGFRRVKNVEEFTEIYYAYQMLSALSVISLLDTYTGFGLLGLTGATIPVIIGFFWGNAERLKHPAEVNEVIDINLNFAG